MRNGKQKQNWLFLKSKKSLKFDSQKQKENKTVVIEKRAKTTGKIFKKNLDNKNISI